MTNSYNDNNECIEKQQNQIRDSNGKFVEKDTTSVMKDYALTISHISNLGLDVHLMVEDPEKYIPLYASLNTEYIVFHVEVDKDITKLLKMIKQYSIKAGLSIKPNTKVSELVPYLPYLDTYLIDIKHINPEKCKELAKRITEDYKGKQVLLVGLLKGSVPFLAELSKYIIISPFLSL